MIGLSGENAMRFIPKYLPSHRLAAFPNLSSENHRVTSCCTPLYNCVAYAMGDDKRWWEPSGRQGTYWPLKLGPNILDNYIKMFQIFGNFDICSNGDVERHFFKIAVFYNSSKNTGTKVFTHVAKMLADGKWSSKLGEAEDIEHSKPEDLFGSFYGTSMVYMKRQEPNFGDATSNIFK